MKTKRQGQSKLFVVLATLLAIVFFSFAGETDVKAAETYTQNYTPTRKSPLKKIEYINRGDNTFDINVVQLPFLCVRRGLIGVVLGASASPGQNYH